MLRFSILFVLIFSLNSFATFDWQSHRGGRGLFPENTIFAMKESLKFPITTLELDVVISKDHQVVVSHEPWMNEEMCQNAKGKEINLYKLNYQEIKKYDCGSKPHPRFPRQVKSQQHKPLLKDLLKALSKSGKRFNIEIKSTPEDEAQGFQPEYKKFSDLVMEVVLKELPTSVFSIQSFDWRVLKYLNQKHPEVKLVALRESAYVAKNVFDELGFVPAIFSPDFELLTAPDVAYFHEKNVKVIPWTVNHPEAMKKMIGMHVDGIITDYPDLIKDIPVESYQSKKKCEKGFNLFEGECVKVPAHAEVSDQNPGWVCDAGYLQKRNSCVKTKLPKHAFFAEDGKTWICKDGYKRYRYRCLKK